jgi:hypothetical protein
LGRFSDALHSILQLTVSEPVCYVIWMPYRRLTGIGIGGMAAALALGQRGHHVIVFESAPKVCIKSLRHGQKSD